VGVGRLDRDAEAPVFAGDGFRYALRRSKRAKNIRITVGDDGGLVDTQTGLAVTAIDLRDGQPALLELADGRYLPVHADMVVPPEVPHADLVADETIDLSDLPVVLPVERAS